MTKDQLEIRKKKLPEVIIISTIIPLMLFIVVPIEIYSSNYEEFNFSFGDFILTNILLFFILFAINFLLLFFIVGKTYKILKSLNLAIATLMFVQGSYLNMGLNSLIGDNLATNTLSNVYIYLDIFLWVAVITAFVVFAIIKTKKTILSSISLILAVILLSTQAISPISVFASNSEITVPLLERQANDEDKVYMLSNKGLTTFASSNNVYYFCIDRFEESFAESALTDYPDIYDELTGFTWFQDYISAYAHTYPAVATMLTDKEYDISKKRTEFLNDVFSGQTALSKMSDNGYKVNIYTESYYSFTNATELPEYIANREEISELSINSRMGITSGLVGLALFRCLPFGVKNVLAVLNSNIMNSFVSCYSEDGNEDFRTLNERVFKIISSNTFDVADEKQFSFIHFSGCHDTSKRKYFSSPVKYCFDMINMYLSELKTQGLYDDATIIITGDHPDSINDTTEVYEPRITALFVKPSNSPNENLKISQAQVAQCNLWVTIFKSENIEHVGSSSVFDIDENENQIRYHYFHTYDILLTEYIYEITGPGKQFENWEKIDEKHYNRTILD